MVENPKNTKGQGHGKEYKPGLTVRDVPSEGLSSRIKGWRTERVHHFFSLLELNYFYILDWSKKVIDIREQYPLPFEATKEIAERLNIKHPTNPKTKEPVIMTTDFLIDIELNSQRELRARTIKPEEKLNNKRVLEKFEIERTYWTENGVDWGIVTENEIPKILAENIKNIHSYRDIKELPGITPLIVQQVEKILYQKLSVFNLRLSHVALETDSEFGLTPGSCLSIIRHFLAVGLWTTNMEELIDTGKCIKFVRAI